MKKLWVQIYEDEKGDLSIALVTSVEKALSSLSPNVSIVYLRPFEIPFDALAHKHLLDSLSKDSVSNWIDKHKEETKIQLRAFDKD